MTAKLDKLLDELDGLCAAYIGKKAEAESWLTTLERLKRINTLRKAVRLERWKEQNPQAKVN